MKIQEFICEFDQVFPEPSSAEIDGYIDPIPEISGIAAPKALWLLNLAYSFLDPREAYLEIGASKGKGLVAALRYNDIRPNYICDDYTRQNSCITEFSNNMRRCKLTDKIFFFNSSFLNILNVHSIKHPVGCYFCNGNRTMDSQYDAIVFAEPLFSNEALIIINDWNDLGIRKGTFAAIEGSDCEWALLHDLPSRHALDCEMWWNGIAVFSFKQTSEVKE